MGNDERIAALEAGILAFADREAIERCVRQLSCEAENALVERILANEEDKMLREPGPQPSASDIQTPWVRTEFVTTVVVEHAIAGDSATAESLRIAMYSSGREAHGTVVTIRLRDVLMRDGDGWRVVSRKTVLQAMLTGDLRRLAANDFTRHRLN